MYQNIVFISGANRGIGLEFVRQLVERGDRIVAGYRTVATSGDLLQMVKENENVYAVRIEVTDQSDMAGLRDFITGEFGYLDLIINNAGINLRYATPIDEIESGDIMENFRVNVIGSFLAGKYLRSLLAKSKYPRLVNITSGMGSVTRSKGDATPYRISKAALNMLSRNQSIAYREDDIITVALHPGWVRTDMGGPEAPLPPSRAVANMLKIIDNLSQKHNGTFISHEGNILPY